MNENEAEVSVVFAIGVEVRVTTGTTVSIVNEAVAIVDVLPALSEAVTLNE